MLNPTLSVIHLAVHRSIKNNRFAALFAGRLSAEKGIETLIKAWSGVDDPLFIAGEGPDEKRMRKAAPSSVTFLGWLNSQDLKKRFQDASCFIFPSECYETFGLSLLEAMAFGKAIIASDLGPRREMIEDGKSGLLFKAGDAADLRTKIDRLKGDAALRQTLGNAARKAYLEYYTPEKNYEILMAIYEKARQQATTRTTSPEKI